MQTTAEKLLNIALTLAVLGAYGALVLRALRGGTSRLGIDGARVRELLGRTEPSILLDSARLVAAAAWLRYIPDPATYGEALASTAALAVPKGLFAIVDVSLVPPVALEVLAWVYRVSLVSMGLGFAARTSAALAGIANVLAWSIAFSFEHTAHFHAVPLILFALAACPVRGPSLLGYLAALREGRTLESVGTYPAWVRFAAIFAVTTAYFQAGIEKLIRSGPLWLNGTTLEGHLLRVGNELGQHVADAPRGLLVLASAGVLIWELLFGLVLFLPRLRVAGALSAAAFHGGLYLTMGLGFRHLVASLFFLVPPHTILRGLARSRIEARGREPSRAPIPAAQGRGASLRIGIVALTILLQWVPTFARGGVYPFLSYDMFNGFYRGGERLVRRAYLLGRAHEGAWQELDPTAVLSLSQAHFTEQIFHRYVSEHPRHARWVPEREGHCRMLLELVRGSSPALVELRLDADTARAGARSPERIELIRCAPRGH